MTQRSLSLSLLACFTLFAPAANAQSAELTLSASTVEWNQPVVAHITGFGCNQVIGEPQALPPNNILNDRWELRIELGTDDGGCGLELHGAFALDVVLPELYPGEYDVEVYDTAAFDNVGTPIPAIPLATAPLTAHPEATLDVRVPHDATDAAPVALTFVYPSSTDCASFVTPEVEGSTIRLAFDDNCPVLAPPGTPAIGETTIPVGPLAAGTYDVLFLDFSDFDPSVPAPLHRETLVVHDADGCVPSPTRLCLQDGRFAVEVAWRDYAGNEGAGHPVALAESAGTSGHFWFFSPDNVELTVKVLEGCGSNGAYWVFLSSGTTVRTVVTVTDTATGASKTYENELREAAPLIADTSAFSCASS